MGRDESCKAMDVAKTKHLKYCKYRRIRLRYGWAIQKRIILVIMNKHRQKHTGTTLDTESTRGEREG